ncbi:hypothetical protein COO60DRAFT_1458208 [Scenedesmus sp. NREL 46B-D3]|nr:hypothetical protein COO60DRAFT_1458208 [Scenedesmus sp. NREL 46B-D3]
MVPANASQVMSKASNLIGIPIIAVTQIALGAMFGRLAAAAVEGRLPVTRLLLGWGDLHPTPSAAAIAASTAAALRMPALTRLACAFGNTVTLPLMYLMTMLPAADAGRATGFMSLFHAAWSPCLWVFGYRSIQGAGKPKGGGEMLVKKLWGLVTTIGGLGFVRAVRQAINPPVAAVIAGLTLGLSPAGSLLCDASAAAAFVSAHTSSAFTAWELSVLLECNAACAEPSADDAAAAEHCGAGTSNSAAATAAVYVGGATSDAVGVSVRQAGALSRLVLDIFVSKRHVQGVMLVTIYQMTVPGVLWCRGSSSWRCSASSAVFRQCQNRAWLEGRRQSCGSTEVWRSAPDTQRQALAGKQAEKNFVVDVGAPFPAQLPLLAFEGATRRNRPSLVTATSWQVQRVWRPERRLCAGVQLGHARALLARPPAPVLAALGAKLQFELAVGMNGRVWLDSSSCSTTVKVANVLQHAQGVAAAEA